MSVCSFLLDTVRVFCLGYETGKKFHSKAQ